MIKKGRIPCEAHILYPLSAEKKILDTIIGVPVNGLMH